VSDPDVWVEHPAVGPARRCYRCEKCYPADVFKHRLCFECRRKVQAARESTPEYLAKRRARRVKVPRKKLSPEERAASRERKLGNDRQRQRRLRDTPHAKKLRAAWCSTPRGILSNRLSFHRHQARHAVNPVRKAAEESHVARLTAAIDRLRSRTPESPERFG
jgi:hypothetical protein